ncbi:MAG TPA: hypothetical protein VHT68_25750 [Pseudolabrys sp.]|jgi:hypothetical protein|nr:hypothetical protein [Pseudolabrys sp.]
MDTATGRTDTDIGHIAATIAIDRPAINRPTAKALGLTIATAESTADEVNLPFAKPGTRWMASVADFA